MLTSSVCTDQLTGSCVLKHHQGCYQAQQLHPHQFSMFSFGMFANLTVNKETQSTV